MAVTSNGKFFGSRFKANPSDSFRRLTSYRCGIDASVLVDKEIKSEEEDGREGLAKPSGVEKTSNQRHERRISQI